MQPERVRTELCDRGVWEAPYLKDGCVVLVAIDSRREERKRVKLLPGISYERAKTWLEQLLDRVDPLPPPRKLELVRDVASPRRAPRQAFSHDPNDFRRYRNRLIQNAAHRVRVFRD